ncbi:hypothetical protein ACSSS7_004758 [Eimeria intestinalis]
MELIYAVETAEGSACALLASYAYPPGGLTISALGKKAAEAAGRAVRLHTPDGDFKEPMTIIRYLCEKSEARSTLLGPEKNPAAQAAITQWLTFCASRGFQVSGSGDLNEFNTALQLNTFLCGNTISAADIVAMASVHASMTAVADVIMAAEEAQKKKGPKNQQQGKQQKSAENAVEKRTDSDGKKKGDAAGKQKPKSAESPKAEERPVDDPMRLDFRVGLVKRVWRHPEADKLYCEEIDFGPLGVRQIASGLVPYLPQEKFEGQKVVVLFNLKAKALRGFDSHGMVMCASSEDKSATELLQPPPDTPLGERVIVQGMQGEADEVLSSKKGKDPLVACSPFLKTKDDCGAYFKASSEERRQRCYESIMPKTINDLPLVTPQGPVKCNSIKNGNIS